MAAVHAVHTGSHNDGGRYKNGRVPVLIIWASRFNFCGQVNSESGPGEGGAKYGVLDEGSEGHQRTDTVQTDAGGIRGS